jgi:hypothetical protein
MVPEKSSFLFIHMFGFMGPLFRQYLSRVLLDLVSYLKIPMFPDFYQKVAAESES